jgi:hypothetical protein
MVDERGDARFVHELRDEVGFAQKLWMEPLDGYRALETGGTGETSEVNGRHPSGRNLTVQAVTANALLDG